jgi:hypothetical protein
MSYHIQLNTHRANALITGLMAAYGDLQEASFNATREGRILDAELAAHRLSVCDDLIADILGAFEEVDGWPEIPKGNSRATYCCKSCQGIQ